MADHSGHFVFALRQRHEFARDVDAPARKHERIGIRAVNQREFKSQVRRRQVLDYALAYPSEIACDLFVINHAEVMLDLFGNGIAEVRFLFFGEDVLLA